MEREEERRKLEPRERKERGKEETARTQERGSVVNFSQCK